MGEAKRKKQIDARKKFDVLNGLVDDTAIIAHKSISLFDNFILPERYTGGCYHMTMFLYLYLQEKCGINVDPVVGYVNDGTDDIMISHAWIEYQGLKTDLTLFLIDKNISAPNGNVLILDRIFRNGQVQHTYHREQNDAGLEQIDLLMKIPEMRSLLIQKQCEHEEMVERFGNRDAIYSHMARAPIGLRFDDLMSAVDRS